MDTKAGIFQSLTDSQLSASIANILHPPLSTSSQLGGGGGTQPGWIDAHLSTLPTQPESQPQNSCQLQAMMGPQSGTSPSFLSVPFQNFSSQNAPKWMKSPAPASLQNRFFKVSCDLCNHISFSQHAHARHMTIRHSRRGDFACGECGKVFQTKLYLNQHMKSHGERKYACEVCGQRFLYKHHLPRHQLAVHGAVTYNTHQQPPREPPGQHFPVVFENPDG